MFSYRQTQPDPRDLGTELLIGSEKRTASVQMDRVTPVALVLKSATGVTRSIWSHAVHLESPGPSGVTRSNVSFHALLQRQSSGAWQSPAFTGFMRT